jgi:hypothetical protein
VVLNTATSFLIKLKMDENTELSGDVEQYFLIVHGPLFFRRPANRNQFFADVSLGLADDRCDRNRPHPEAIKKGDLLLQRKAFVVC